MVRLTLNPILGPILPEAGRAIVDTDTYACGALDWITPTSSSVTNCYYDANGNVVDRVTSANASYTFDVDNRLVQAVTSAGTYTFTYDGLGDRVRETGPSGSKTFNNTVVASGDAMLYLKDVVGSTTTKTVYLYAGSLLVASLAGSTTSYFHEDALGDTRLVTQSSHGSATVVFATNYEPFGVQYATSGADPSVKYTGQWDEALGLYWNHARFYDPTLGRFVSADPVLGHLSSPQTLDRYAYAVDDPERFADPSGRDCSWNPMSWGDCLASAGQTVVNGATSVGQGVSNWWNGLSSQDKAAILVIGIVAVSIITLGVGGAILGGAVGGAMVAAATGAAVTGALSAGIAAGAQYATTGHVSLSTVATAFAVGAIIGGVTAGLGSYLGAAGDIGGLGGGAEGVPGETASLGETAAEDDTAFFQNAMLRSMVGRQEGMAGDELTSYLNFLTSSPEQAAGRGLLESFTSREALTQAMKYFIEGGVEEAFRNLYKSISSPGEGPPSIGQAPYPTAYLP